MIASVKPKPPARYVRDGLEEDDDDDLVRTAQAVKNFVELKVVLVCIYLSSINLHSFWSLKCRNFTFRIQPVDGREDFSLFCMTS